MTIVSDKVPYTRSVALGFWMRSGTRDEPVKKGGISHFLEHLIFKGTPTHSARDIAEIFDSIGGELNAFSSKEYTCFYARILDKNLPLAIDVLTDMIANSMFNKKDIGAERKVILEEIRMHQDAPSELIYDYFDRLIFKDHPLSRPILGTSSSIRGINRDDIRTYYKNHYFPADMVVAAAGNISHNNLVKLLENKFVGIADKKNDRTTEELKNNPRVSIHQRMTQQGHICFGVEGLPVNHPSRFALAVLDTILGGGMSSRLFQNIREKRGLVYSIHSYHSNFSEKGIAGIYAGTQPKKTRLVVDLIAEEIGKISDQGPTQKEIDRAKEHAKGTILLSMEDTTIRMSRLAKSEVYDSEYLTADDLVDRIDKVTLDEVIQLANDMFSQPRVLTLIGPFKEKEFNDLGDVSVTKSKK